MYTLGITHDTRIQIPACWAICRYATRLTGCTRRSAFWDKKRLGASSQPTPPFARHACVRLQSTRAPLPSSSSFLTDVPMPKHSSLFSPLPLPMAQRVQILTVYSLTRGKVPCQQQFTNPLFIFQIPFCLKAMHTNSHPIYPPFLPKVFSIFFFLDSSK